MNHTLFAIIDVETTGGGMNGNRITEICIVILRGASIVDKFTTLVNPDKYIPRQITALTGIDNELVENAPRFYEVAEKINEMTRDTIFVAHNVNFDYNVLRNELKNVGINFTRKKLCTVRLSRKLIPGLASYSLGKLCASVNIPLNNRHRAEGDTDATVILFQRLLTLDLTGEIMSSFLHVKSKEATLPPHLSSDQVFQLPETAGVYLFKDRDQKVIYVGKAKDIKKRVLSHIYGKNTKEYTLCQETHHIDYELTGNELTALLLEADYIQKYHPKHNRAQKRPAYAYQIISYINRRGIIQLGISKTRSLNDSLLTSYSLSEATEKLSELCETHHLCPRYCGLQSKVEKCSHYRIQNCEGICEKKETVENYNKKVTAAIRSLEDAKPTYLIKEKGRDIDETAFIFIQEGSYCGFGFINDNVSISNPEECKNYLIQKMASYHTHKIIKSYLKKQGEQNVVYF
ncbi:MAG: GIY-YIG nuclease family protein [Bacteroidetes bacterium]|nr:GIY-YIG nuclease family protein [Bacteroidota bacterium]